MNISNTNNLCYIKIRLNIRNTNDLCNIKIKNEYQ